MSFFRFLGEQAMCQCIAMAMQQEVDNEPFVGQKEKVSISFGFSVRLSFRSTREICGSCVQLF